MDIKGALTRPLGPLPAWAWGVVIGGGYLLYRYLKNGSLFGSSTTAATTTAATVPASDYGGGGTTGTGGTTTSTGGAGPVGNVVNTIGNIPSGIPPIVNGTYASFGITPEGIVLGPGLAIPTSGPPNGTPITAANAAQYGYSAQQLAGIQSGLPANASSAEIDYVNQMKQLGYWATQGGGPVSGTSAENLSQVLTPSAYAEFLKEGGANYETATGNAIPASNPAVTVSTQQVPATTLNIAAQTDKVVA